VWAGLCWCPSSSLRALVLLLLDWKRYNCVNKFCNFCEDALSNVCNHQVSMQVLVPLTQRAHMRPDTAQLLYNFSFQVRRERKATRAVVTRPPHVRQCPTLVRMM
jgi:hypothetical protein